MGRFSLGQYLGDLGKTALNTVLTPVELLAGNVYDPRMETNLGSGVQRFQNTVGEVGSALLPAAANMVVPGSGAVVGMAQQAGRQISGAEAGAGYSYFDAKPQLNEVAPTTQNDNRMGQSAFYGYYGGKPVYGQGKPSGPSHMNGGIDMYNSQTGQYVGEMEGKERIFSVQDTKTMEQMAEKKQYSKLGKYIHQAIEKQNQLQGNGGYAAEGIDTSYLIGPGNQFNAPAYTSTPTGIGSGTNPWDAAAGIGGAGNLLNAGQPSGFEKAGGFGTIADALRFGIGIAGATKKLPEYEIPSEYTGLVDRLGEMSKEGFTPEERSLAKRDLLSGRATASQNVRQTASGIGQYLTGLQGVQAVYQRGQQDLAVADAQLRRTNIDRYGNYLRDLVGRGERNFDRKYSEQAQTKAAAAGLASEALQNMVNRQDYNENKYGPYGTYEYRKKLYETLGTDDFIPADFGDYYQKKTPVRRAGIYDIIK